MRYLKVLEKIEIAQRHLEGDKYITISLVPQYMKDIFNAFFPNDDDPASLANLKLALHVAFTKRLNFILTTNNFSLKAAVLDPRTCLKVKSLITADLYNEVWDSIIDECYLCRKCDVMSRDVFAALCGAIRPILESTNVIEIKDPLLWWKAKSDFTLIHDGVKMILSVPASSASSERVFSSSGLIMNVTRNRLNPNLLEQMTILRMWLRTKNLSSPTDLRIIASSLIDQFRSLHLDEVITDDDEIDENEEEKEEESEEDEENEEDEEDEEDDEEVL
jgi:hypothetical protein